jgi:Arm DNA-binding domain/Protein of unknown function (DUF2934)
MSQIEQVDQDLSERIRERAYEIWVANGYRDGEADQHWLAAEHEIEVVTTEPQPTETTDEAQPRETTGEVLTTEPRPTETTGEVVTTEPQPTDTTDEVVTTESQPKETIGEVVTTEPRPPDENDEVVEAETQPANDKIAETGAQPTDMSAEVEQTERRPDLVWDAEAHGLCVRAYGDGSKSFIFVYRLNDRQHFIRIGKTPTWSLEAARERAKKLRSILDQGEDPASYQKQNTVAPVESVIRFIAEHLRTEP